jgi:hypothetical protein
MKSYTDKNGIELLVPAELMDLKESLRSIPNVGIITLEFHLTFAQLFASNILQNSRYFVFTTFIKRSNWTHITATSFFETCKPLNRTCEFEVVNRHDGVVRNPQGDIEILAEWEYQPASIFGQKGEILKLLKSQKKYAGSEAILFTYWDRSSYVDFLSKVYEEYNSALQKSNDFRMVLMVALLDNIETDKTKEISTIRIVEIGKDYINLYADVYMD